MSCKTINIDLTNVPPVPIQIGVAGENSFRTITFDASKWGADYPDATYTVVYRRSDGYLYPVLVNASADAIVWNPTGTDTAVSGNGQLEVRLLDGETIGKTIIMQTYVAPSLSGDESEPSTPAPDWVNDVADDADRAEDAVSHYPQIRNGYWWVWDVESGEWVNTGVKATGEGGTAADAVLYTPQDLTDEQKEQARENIGAGTYSKPSGGIPKSDLASAVQASLGKADTALQTAPVQSVNGQTGAVTIPIPTVPAMATEPDMEDWTSGKTVDASAMKTVFSAARTAILANSGEIDSLKSDKQDATLEIPITTNDDGESYTTTVTAAQIRAAKENAVFVFDTLRIDATAWLPGFIDTNTDMLVGVLDSDLRIQIVVSLANDSVSITVRMSQRQSIPTKVSELTNDSGYQTAQDVQTAISTAVSGKADKEPRVAMASTDTSATLNPNTLYVFPEMASLAITLATPTDTGIANEYHFIFTSGSTATTLSIPATVNQPDGFSVESNHVYEVSILEGNMTAQGWAVTA